VHANPDPKFLAGRRPAAAAMRVTDSALFPQPISPVIADDDTCHYLASTIRLRFMSARVRHTGVTHGEN